MFIVKNRDLFKLNSDIHNIGTGHNNNNFHLPSAQSKLFQKGVFLFRNLNIQPPSLDYQGVVL
jgi:hypothetical protein